MKVNVNYILLPRNNMGCALDLLLNGIEYHYHNIQRDSKNKDGHIEDWEYLDKAVPDAINAFKDLKQINKAWTTMRSNFGNIEYYSRAANFIKNNKELFDKYKDSKRK